MSLTFKDLENFRKIIQEEVPGIVENILDNKLTSVKTQLNSLTDVVMDIKDRLDKRVKNIERHIVGSKLNFES